MSAYEKAKEDNFATGMSNSMAQRAAVVQAVLDTVESPAKWICYPTYMLSVLFRYVTVGMAFSAQLLRGIPCCMPKEYDKDFGVAKVTYKYSDGSQEEGMTGTGPIVWCLMRVSLMVYAKGAAVILAVLSPVMYLLSTLFYYMSLFPFMGVDAPPPAATDQDSSAKTEEVGVDVEKAEGGDVVEGSESTEDSAPVTSNPMLRDAAVPEVENKGASVTDSASVETAKE